MYSIVWESFGHEYAFETLVSLVRLEPLVCSKFMRTTENVTSRFHDIYNVRVVPLQSGHCARVVVVLIKIGFKWTALYQMGSNGLPFIKASGSVG